MSCVETTGALINIGGSDVTSAVTTFASPGRPKRQCFTLFASLRTLQQPTAEKRRPPHVREL